LKKGPKGPFFVSDGVVGRASRALSWRHALPLEPYPFWLTQSERISGSGFNDVHTRIRPFGRIPL